MTDNTTRNWSMPKDEALAIVLDIASRWGENMDEQFPRRLQAEDTDETLSGLVEGNEDDMADAVTLRNLWRAIEVLKTKDKLCGYLGKHRVKGDSGGEYVFEITERRNGDNFDGFYHVGLAYGRGIETGPFETSLAAYNDVLGIK